MSVLKTTKKIKGRRLLGNSFTNFWATMTQASGPKARQTVKHFSSIGSGNVTTLRRNDHSWILFELTITRKGHPMSIKLRLGHPSTIIKLLVLRTIVGFE
ncbi:MAG: Uncharacterised protein [Porticoccaceae bacterium UBA1117]|nr:MAG: Uncharacterised protein [Porticoccaceae bacterium UBA1117]